MTLTLSLLLAAYSFGARQRWAAETGLPELTAHACDRWGERTPDDSIAPETALSEAGRRNARDDMVSTLPYFQQFGDHETDTVYVYKGRTEAGVDYCVAFIVVDFGTPNAPDERVLTVYDVETIDTQPLQSYLHSVAGGVNNERAV